MEEWRWMTAADLGREISAGQIDPIDLTEVYLNAIENHAEASRIYSYVTSDRARSEARAASVRAKTGLRRSLLDGVPISWKDLFDTVNVPTEAGTALMAGRVPERDAVVLENAAAAGLVCLGKTHLSEIAFSGLGVNPMTQTPPCVNDPDAAPGGSSSGAAASVAFGLAAAGIGSDTGGSVRIPSAWNDLTGLKTTHGRISTERVVPLCRSFDTVGPLCRSVEDTALFLNVLEGSGTFDLAQTSLDGKHLAVLKTIAMDDVEEAPLKAFNVAVERLTSVGAIISTVEIPDLVTAFGTAAPLYTGDSWSWWRDLIEANPAKMYSQIYDRIKVGADVSAADYLTAWRTLKDVRRVYCAQTAAFDAVIMPSCPIMPPSVERLLNEPDYYLQRNLLALRNTRVANLMDVPAMSLPTSIASCGIMFNGHRGNEEKLLRIARAAELALA